jgi:Zn-dependent protease/CBS domain-containing protein
MDETQEPQPRRWSWRIGRIAGIAIYIHATFVILLAWIAVSHLAAGYDLAMTGQGVLLVVCVFATVVVHELSHALVARRFGIATRDITLYPIGGIARLERMPEKPGQELLVAIAGPLTNGVLALAIFIGLRVAGEGAGGDPLTVGGSFALQLMWINVSLGVFNLVPAFPMDGGRVLRAALAFRMDRARATAVAARIGRGIAVVFGIVGLLWSPMLVLIAVFVWMTAGQEAAMEQLRSSLRGVSVGDAMVAEFRTLSPETPLDTAAKLLATGFQHDFPVVEDGRIIGVLTRPDILRGLATSPRDATVARVMHRAFPIAGSHEQLDSVLGRMPPDGSSVIVLHDENVVGILDPTHVGDVLAARATSRVA